MKNTIKPASRAKARTTTSRAAEAIAPKLPTPSRREIAMRAYEIYARSGHQPGREVEFWLEAERQLQHGPKK